MVLHRGIRKSSAWTANFKLELETHETDDVVFSYFASLSGELTKLEGRDAVVNAYSYVPGRLVRDVNLPLCAKRTNARFDL